MINIKRVIRKIIRRIKKYDTIVIGRHIGPDPDAVASTFALKRIINKNYPKKKVYVVGAPVSKYKEYGSYDKIPLDFEYKNALLIALDVPNLHRIDGTTPSLFKEIIKIDHHPFEDKMGELEWIEEGYSSASEMICELLIDSYLTGDKEIASLLYMGIVSDSERFVFANYRTLFTVSKLLYLYELDMKSIYTKLYSRPINELKFKSYLGNNLVITDNKLAYIIVEQDIIKEFNVDNATPSNMINDFNYIEDYIVWIFITYDEKNSVYKASMRSRGPIINEIASRYNGGGHLYASGARIKTMDEVNMFLEELDKKCKEYLSK